VATAQPASVQTKDIATAKDIKKALLGFPEQGFLVTADKGWLIASAFRQSVARHTT
jgi:hypothetical protein